MTLPFAVRRLLDAAGVRIRRLRLLTGLAAVGGVWILGVAAVMAVDSRIVIFDDRLRWAMSGGVLLLAALTALFGVVLPLRRKADDRRTAMALDARHPEHEERLSSLVELAQADRSRAGFSLSLFNLLCDLATADAEKIDLAREFPRTRAVRALAAFAALLLSLVLSIAVSPRLVGCLFVRALAPWADVGNLYSDDIAVDPGDVVAISGSVIKITASPSPSSSPSPDCSIRLSRRQGLGWSEETEEPMPGGVYETTADLTERLWRYRVHAGPAVTRYYYVRVSQMPKYDLFKATVTYPPYAGLAPSVVSNADVGAIKALAGSRVKFDLVVTDPGTLADFRIGREPVFEHLMVSNRASTWSLALVNEDGFRTDKGTHPLRSVVDQPPAVVVEKPTSALQLPTHATFPIELTATDDVGITSACLRVSVDGGDWMRARQPDLPLVGDRKFVRAVTEVDLSLYDLILAKGVRFDIVVTDGCPPEFGGPHSATSAPVTVRFAESAASYEMQELKGEVEAAGRELAEARKRLGDAQTLARQVGDELRRSPKVSASTEAKSERLAHELDEAQKRISELREDFLGDERFAPLARPLERLLDEAMSPALEAVENAAFRDRDERADAVLGALPEMEKAVREIDDFTRRLAERAEKVRGFEKARDLAARQEALARAAEEIMAERPLDTAKLEAWRRLEEAAMRQAEEFARNAPDSDFAEARRKMETAAREMAGLQSEIMAAKQSADLERRAAEAAKAEALRKEAEGLRELQAAIADQRRAQEALAQSNLTVAAQAQRAARAHLKGADALPSVKALQDLATDRPSVVRQEKAAEAAKREAALREAISKGEKPASALTALDRELRKDVQRETAAAKSEASAKAAGDKAAEEALERTREAEAKKAAEQIRNLEKAAAAQEKAQAALDAVAARREAADRARRTGEAPLDAKHRSALAEEAKAAARAAQEAAASQREADALLRQGEATEGTKALQQLADKAAAASQKKPHDVDRAHRAAAAQQAASKALNEEKQVREAMAAGEKTSADLEALDRAAQAEAREASAAFDRAEKASAEGDQSANGQNNRTAQEIRQAMADQNRAAQALHQAAMQRAAESRQLASGNPSAANNSARQAEVFERQAAEAQRAAEDRMERAGVTEGVKALQREATVAARAAHQSPRTQEKFDLAAAAQKAAAEALKNELAVREGIARGEMTDADLAALDDRLKDELHESAARRKASTRTAAEAVVRRAKDALGSEDEEVLQQLADKATEAVRDAVAADLSASRLDHDEARAAALHEAEDALTAAAAEATEEEAREDRIRSLQQAAAEAIERNDRNRAQKLQGEISREQARAAEAAETEDELTARSAAEAAQTMANEMTDQPSGSWNNETRAQALSAQKRAMASEAEAQAESRVARAVGQIAAAERQLARQFSQPTQSARSDEDAASASQEASEAMNRAVSADAASLGMSRGQESEKKSSGGGGVTEEMSKLASDLKRKDNPDFFKSLFARLGWFKIRGLSKDGLGDAELKEVPREYRDLVRRYFLKLAEEAPKAD